MAVKGLFNRRTDIVAVEIDDLYLKLAHGVRDTGKTRITKVRTIYDKALSEDGISSAIEQFMKDSGVKKCTVISVIPARFGVYKNIEIPSIDRQEIKQIIDLQAGAHTPYPKNEIIVDYVNAGVFHERYTKVLLVILKKDIVTKRYDLIKRAGFKAEMSVLSAEPAARVFFDLGPGLGKNEITAMIDVDMAFSNFTVIKGGNIIYVRAIPSGIREISGRGEPGIAGFRDEVKMSLEAYQANNIDDLPARIYFVGKKTIMDGIAGSYAKASPDIESVAFDILEGADWVKPGDLEGPAELSALSVLAPVLHPEEGCLDLTPEDIRVRKEIKKKSMAAMKLGIFSMLALIFFCVILLSDLVMKKMYLDRLELSYTSENKEVARLNAVMETTAKIKRFINEKGTGLSGMAALFRAIPGEVYLTSIDFRDGDTFTFTGTAGSMSGVFSLVTELEGTPFFKNVNVDFTRSRSQRGEEVADFGLTLTIEKESI